VELDALEAWGRSVVERAAELILAEIPEAQIPRTGATGRAITAGRGYVSRYVHFRRPDMADERAVWLFVVPAGHDYNVDHTQARAGAGLMQNVDTELDPTPLAAGVPKPNAFSWRRHLDQRYAGYRLFRGVDPDVESPDAVADELASRVLSGLRRARLIDRS
jgi:hypothetical protein